MIIFPLDNEGYEAQALGAWCGTRTRGVFADDAHYTVTNNGDMSVTVSPGLAWLKRDTYWGVDAFEPNPTLLAIDTADGALARIDAICIRLDKNTNNGMITVKKGAYAVNPKLENPIRDLNYDEIYVAYIMVRAGATEILPEDIFDLRLDETYCGIMRDGVTGIPTQQLYDQWLAWFATFQGDAQSHFALYKVMVQDLYVQYQSDIAVHEGNAIAVYDAFVQRMNDYETTAKIDFESWVATLKDILDDEVAGHLQLEIEELQKNVPSAVLGTVTFAGTLYPLCQLLSGQWAYGIGGAGLGPAGGTSLVTIPHSAEHSERTLAVSAPSQYAAYTDINPVSNTMFSFLSDDSSDISSLLLHLFN